jgi:hypothetical protein
MVPSSFMYTLSSMSACINSEAILAYFLLCLACITTSIDTGGELTSLGVRLLF